MNTAAATHPTTGDNPQQSLRDDILAAAMGVLRVHGVKHLSQARVAKEVGIRQSHLTYYFPKRVDLISALLQDHIDKASLRLDAASSGEVPDMQAALEMLCSNRERMRFFLGLIIEADQNDELKAMLDAHIAQFDRLVAYFFGRPENDPDVKAYLGMLRGLGMTNMVQGGSLTPVDVKALGEHFGLAWRSTAGG
ncbi:MAG: TetR/AcrR family transcriptional regulator [Pseudomonadota bacterium]